MTSDLPSPRYKSKITSKVVAGSAALVMILVLFAPGLSVQDHV
jgi:hypothetical protein